MLIGGTEMFTKQHYKAIAEIINNRKVTNDNYCCGCELDGAEKTRLHIVNQLAGYFAQDNELFDREKFLKACGLEK
jgi:hypothetical protein